MSISVYSCKKGQVWVRKCSTRIHILARNKSASVQSETTKVKNQYLSYWSEVELVSYMRPFEHLEVKCLEVQCKGKGQCYKTLLMFKNIDYKIFERKSFYRHRFGPITLEIEIDGK